MRVFRERSIRELFETTNKKIYDEIQGLSEDRLLKTELTTLASEIANKYKINIDISVSTENVSNEIKMESIRQMPEYFIATVRYGFSVSGNLELLKYQPTKQTHIGVIRGELTASSKLTIIIETQWANPELDEKTEKFVTTQITSHIEAIESNIEGLKAEAKEYNENLVPDILKFLPDKKAEVIEKNKRRDRLNPFN